MLSIISLVYEYLDPSLACKSNKQTISVSSSESIHKAGQTVPRPDELYK